MSHCPYTLLAEQELVPFVIENAGRIDFTLHYIATRVDGSNPESPDGNGLTVSLAPREESGCSGEGHDVYLEFSSMHGRAEIEEDMRQLLIKELYPESYLDYLLLLADGNCDEWQDAAGRLGIDVSLIHELTGNGMGARLLEENISSSRERTVRSSPTLFINGERFSGNITLEAVKAEVFGTDVRDEKERQGEESRFTSALQDQGNVREKHHDRLGTANPAAIYCLELGYEYKTVGENGQRGICILPDDEECEEWSFLAGTCGQEYSYCARHGYDIATRADGNDPFSREYAVCVSPEDDVIGSVTDLLDLSSKATKASAPRDTGRDEREDAVPPITSAPPSIDWRDHEGYNWVTPVKNQGGCGSCWAFGTVAAVEAVVQIEENDPFLDLDLSEEYLVSDCHGGVFGQNCCGGFHFLAFSFIRNQGIPDESCMPYVDSYSCSCGGGTCDSNCEFRIDSACSDATCSDRCSDWEERLTRIDSAGPVSDTRESIASIGPVAASFGIGSSFGGYWDGDIYRCTNDNGSNHVIALVGYNDAGEYWIAKNSWGTGWGDGGFFKIGYGECNIESDVYYANDISCGDTVRTYMTLYKDLPTCDGDALVIDADNITLDCKGFSITGSGTGSGIILENRQNVFIKNCVVSGFSRGIDLSGSAYNTVIKNTLTENNLYGIYLDNSQFNTIWKNEFVDNAVAAYEEAGSNSNNWFSGQKGNYWSDFQDNPGYPNSYIIAGPGDGIDPWPNDRIHKIYKEATGP